MLALHCLGHNGVAFFVPWLHLLLTTCSAWRSLLSSCRQLGLGDDRNRWAPKQLGGFTIIHPDRTLRRNRKPVLKALLLQEDATSSRSRSRAQ